MSPVIFAFPGNDALARRIAMQADGTVGELFLHRFPDGESYVRLDSPVSGRDVVVVCTLNEPDAKALPLMFALAAAKAQGATRAGVVAPYLGYLRQDAQFKPGEAVTSATFARLLSQAADWIATVDPHLHRYRSLDAVYSIRSAVVHAARRIGDWVQANVVDPLLIGPDEESEQWVAQVAARAGAPHVVLDKRRRGDRDVEVSVPHVDRYRQRTPVLVDDIVSTARTMIAAVTHLRDARLPPAFCVAVHALFGQDAYAALQAAGPARIVTCNTVAHETNAIDVHDALGRAVRDLLA